MSWDWTGVSGEVGRVLATPMRNLQNYLKRIEREMPFTDPGEVRTTDATVTTLDSFAIPVDQTTHIEAVVVARRTGGSGGTANDGASYTVRITAKNPSGTAAVIGSSVTAIGESQVGWDVTVDATGSTIRIRVQGAANNNVRWMLSAKTFSVGDNP